MREFKWSGALLCALVIAACGDDSRPPITGDAGPITRDGGRDAGRPPGDGGADPDAGGDIDAGSLCDGVDCSPMDDMCNLGVCDPADGTCGTEPRADGTACDDADACTTTDVCTAGTCGGTDVECGGMTDMCNVGMCDPTSGLCIAMPMADGTACDDGAGCTSMDVCTAGACAGAAIDCTGFGDDCNTGFCDAATGMCARMPAMDGTACDDGDLCSTGDACTAGSCGGTATDCSGSADMCNTAMCDPATGACVATPVMDGTACDDADACTAMDACGTGTCSGASLTPPGDTCATAIPIAIAGVGTQTLTGTTSCGSNDFQPCAFESPSGGAEVIYTFTLTTPQRITASTTIVAGGLPDTVLGIYSGCETPTEYACNDDTGGLLSSRVDREFPAGTYFMVVDAYRTAGVGAYSVTFTVAAPTLPDTCATAVTIPTPASGTSIRVGGSTTGAAGNFSATCGDSAGSPDHVYRLVLGSAARLRLETLPTTGSYDTVVHVQSSPCASPGTDVACDDDGAATGAFSLIERDFAAGTYFIVVDGYSTGSSGNYVLEIENVAARGHAVLLGHDFFAREVSADRALANSVFLSELAPTGTLQIVDYQQFADTSPTGEIALTRAAIAERATVLGRTVNYTTVTDYTLLDLSTAHVFLVYEQELTSGAMMTTVASAWNAQLNTFIDRGGVVVVLDFGGETWRVLNGTGLLTIPSARGATFQPVTVTTAADPIATGVVSGYAAPNGSNAYPGATGGTVVLSQATDPLCLHLSR